MNKRGFSAVAVTLIVVLVLIVAGGIWYYETHENSPASQSTSQTGSPTSITPEQSISTESTSTIIFSTTSTLVLVSSDPYGLFMVPANEAQYYNFSSFEEQYINDGVIESGPYQGYHRVALYVDLCGGERDCASDQFLLATKDYQSFVLDNSINFDNGSSSQEAVNYLAEDMGAYFNNSKIAGQGPIPLSLPLSIASEGISYNASEYSASATIPTEDVPIPTLVPGLNSFADIVNDPYATSSEYSQGENNYFTTLDNYVFGSSDFVAEDKAGVSAYYFINSPDLKMGGVGFPVVASGTTLYNAYGSENCGETDYNGWYVLKNISDNDLTAIGTNSSGTVFYSLKDSSHPLNQVEYYKQVSSIQDFATVNDGIPAPSFDEFVAKNPILIIKDPFGRLLGINEVQYKYSDVDSNDCGDD